MKQFTITLFFLCAFSVHLSAQPVVSYDPCGELRVAMLTADRLVVEGKLDEALAKLNKFKNDPEMQNCPEMKNGVLDFKINDVKERIEKRDGPKLPSYKTCPDGNHPHLIDLGLPSGTKWACCNVDASKPEDSGGYYAWGETTTKSDYSWKTYKHCDGTEKSCHNLGSSICGTQYDVAHVKWGGTWQLPTKEQFEELLDKCNKGEWTTQNGVAGRKFSGPNGASIFLPAAGSRVDTGFNCSGTYGFYRSGTQYTSNSPYSLNFRSADAYGKGGSRFPGCTVRPVAR